MVSNELEKEIRVTEHAQYTLLWDLAEEMAKQEGKNAEACWVAIMDAFWGGELPELLVFAERRGGIPGRDLMPLPSRDALAGHLLGRIELGDETTDAGELSKWIAELQGWTLHDYQRESEPFRTYVARDVRFGLAVKHAAFEQWRARRPRMGQEHTPAFEPSGARQENRKRRRGPKPGTLRRYEASDKELIPELERIMLTQNKSATAAARALAETSKNAGTGSKESRAKRLVEYYGANKKDRNSP
jgi:hypothetical protein